MREFPKPFSQVEIIGLVTITQKSHPPSKCGYEFSWAFSMAFITSVKMRNQVMLRFLRHLTRTCVQRVLSHAKKLHVTTIKQVHIYFQQYTIIEGRFNKREHTHARGGIYGDMPYAHFQHRRFLQTTARVFDPWDMLFLPEVSRPPS